ncbi:MAG: SPFH/Band 7/PHB domain protein [Labilithrix sp.]|nr:SPFH/Band 7/PHB domain protein [Labilithrix sp.]MCW5816587.1 SPFH/Band 7/PHB domain protein [Labilithrix sp.]
MSSTEMIVLAVGAVLGALTIPLAILLMRAVTFEVHDEQAVLVTIFGKLLDIYTKPGLHMHLASAMPWTKHTRVSLRRDFRHFKNVHLNDVNGTTVIVDLWLEFRIKDPRRAIFTVADWNRSLHNLVAHAATSILGSRSFRQILNDRTELGSLLQEDISHETERWGLEIENVFIRNVSVLPVVSRQMFETIAARLTRAKAHVDEVGRLRVAELEAETAMQVAALVAEAKGQYPAAVGRAFKHVKKKPSVFRAYTELYDLSLLRPERTVAFRGFNGELRAADAAMIVPGADPQSYEGTLAGSPALPASSTHGLPPPAHAERIASEAV